MRNLKRPDSPSVQLSDVKAAVARALDLLSRREHSAWELRHKLETRGFEPEHIDAALEQLSSNGLLNEQRFVESYVYSRVQRGYGPVRIRAELRERGIDSTDWSSDAAINWLGLATAARQKRFGTAAPNDFKERAKQMRFLQRRGFTREQITGAFRNLD